MNVNGISFNRPDFSGATSNQKQQNNILQQMNLFKKQNPNLPNAAAVNKPGQGPLAAGGLKIAQIPAFDKFKQKPNVAGTGNDMNAIEEIKEVRQEESGNLQVA